MTPVLEAIDLSVGYGEPIIKHLSLAVERGEILALLSPNGTGKTTTLLTLAGELKPLSGSVRFLGRPAHEPLHKRAKRGLAFITEERSVFGRLTCRENLRLGRGSVDAAIDIMPELEPILNRKTALCSGGEQQMITLARALAAQPTLLLADELSLGLAPKIVNRLLHVLRSASDKGVAAVLVEQRVGHALSVADRAIVLKDGLVAMEGSAVELRSRVDEIKAVYSLHANSRDLAPGNGAPG